MTSRRRRRCTTRQRVVRRDGAGGDGGGARAPAAARRLTPLPFSNGFEQRWEGPSSRRRRPACVLPPHAGHAMALWATGDADATVAMIRRVVRLKRARNAVFQNADLFRRCSRATLDDDCALSPAARFALLPAQRRSGSASLTALYTNGLAPTRRGFLCVPRAFFPASPRATTSSASMPLR